MDRYKTTFETWNKIASLYQDKFMDLELYNDSYALFCEQVKESNAAILEIGCGPGNITKYLLAQRPDFKVLGIDIAPNMITLAKENNPMANFSVMDCRAIDQLTDRFDAIMCGFCLPYLSKEDVTKLMKDAYALLKTNGVFYFSTIEGDYEKSRFETGSTGDKTFVYYYHENYLTDLLKATNFELIRLMKKDYPKKDTNQIHLIFIAKK